MTSTAIPATLTEYQQFVRKEALKIQQDMGWPDDKLNETLRNLGLPEKRRYLVPVEVTGKLFSVIAVDDVESEETARSQVAAMSSDDLLRNIQQRAGTGQFGSLVPTLMDAMPELAEGGPDVTLSNRAIYQRGQIMCEQTNRSGRHYCTREQRHDGLHAYGDGVNIRAVWTD